MSEKETLQAILVAVTALQQGQTSLQQGQDALRKEFKSDLKDFRNEVNERFARIEHRQERLEDKQERDREMIREIYHSRDKVVAKVSWDFLWKATTFNAFLLVFMFLVLQL